MTWFELNFMEIYWEAVLLHFTSNIDEGNDGDDGDVQLLCNEIICSIFWHKFYDEDKLTELNFIKSKYQKLK